MGVQKKEGREQKDGKSIHGNMTLYSTILSPIYLPFLSSTHPLLPYLLVSQSHMTDESTIDPFHDEAALVETEELPQPAFYV